MGLCGSKLPPPNPNEIDLSHFELLKVVGKGGFGKVNAITKLDTQELLALKRMEKYAVLQSSSHLKMVWIERKIMSMTNSPFLCNLLYAFESERELFLVMPFMQGGDLRFHLKERGTMPVATCQFYAAEMILGLMAMHEKKVVFRDLKPDNMLLDAQGHLRISDFGLACILEERHNWQTTGQAGTRGYQSPEVISDGWYGCEADIWSAGVTIYELLHGVRPWKDWTKLQAALKENEKGEKEKEKEKEKELSDENEGKERDRSRDAKQIHVSSKLDSVTADFLQRILCVDIKKRLGCGPRGWEEVRNHPWFSTIDWDKIARKEVAPPITPDLSRANCTADADLADQLLDRKPRPIPVEQQQHFKGWKFRTEIQKKNSENIVVKPASATNDESAPIPVSQQNEVASTANVKPSAN